MAKIKQVISGGQTGADIAGLKAAKKLKVKTGGYIPAGFRTQAGPKPQYAKRYGLKETKSSGYPDRTKRNVRAADITVIFSPKVGSRGSALTRRYCEKYGKPCLWISKLNWNSIDKIVAAIQDLEQRRVVVNIAGNREESFPGIEKKVYAMVVSVIKGVNRSRVKR